MVTTGLSGPVIASCTFVSARKGSFFEAVSTVGEEGRMSLTSTNGLGSGTAASGTVCSATTSFVLSSSTGLGSSETFRGRATLFSSCDRIGTWRTGSDDSTRGVLRPPKQLKHEKPPITVRYELWRYRYAAPGGKDYQNHNWKTWTKTQEMIASRTRRNVFDLGEGL